MVQKERRWSKEMTIYLLENLNDYAHKNNFDYANLAIKLNSNFNTHFTAEDLIFRFNRLKHEFKNFKKTEGFSKRKKWIYWDLFIRIDDNNYETEEYFKRVADMLSKKFEEIEDLLKL